MIQQKLQNESQNGCLLITSIYYKQSVNLCSYLERELIWMPHHCWSVAIHSNKGIVHFRLQCKSNVLSNFEYHCTYPYHSPFFLAFLFPSHDSSTTPLPSLPGLMPPPHFAFPLLFTLCVYSFPSYSPPLSLSLLPSSPSSSFSSPFFTPPSSSWFPTSPPPPHPPPPRLANYYHQLKCVAVEHFYISPHTQQLK